MTTPILMMEPVVEELQRSLGVLTVSLAGAKVALPLTSVDFQARVADRVAETRMTQVFRNPHAEALEAVYVFPLPGGAAVSRFEMRVKDRVLVGRVEERGEARRQYQQAVAEGKRAALMEKERDDVFTVSVGNLPPGEEITLVIVWSEALPYFDDGTTEIRLPLVVAPRYIPGVPRDGVSVGDGVEPDTDVVPDASRITPPRLAPGVASGVALSLAVELVGAFEDVRCSQHATRLSTDGGGVRVALSRADEKLNRDFVLRWRLAGERVQPRLLAFAGGDGCYCLLDVIPPRREGFLGVPRDVVFVLDRSGSMSGPKMASASRACALLLGTLGPRDRYAIQAFDDQVDWFSAGDFVMADVAGIERGEKFLRGIDARGGTELDGALHAALGAMRGRSGGEGRVSVIVLLTDGQIGNESQVLKRIQRDLGDARVFTVGIDTAINEAFLTRLAGLAGGTSTFVTPGEALEEALRGVGRDIGTPLVVDVSVSDVDAGLSEATRVPDLFEGRAARAWLRLARPGRVRVTGRFADGSPFDAEVAAESVEMTALAQLWARARVADLEDAFRSGDSGAKRKIIELAVKHSLLTRFTAFVVVDEAEMVNKSGTTRHVIQPVEVPDQWDEEAFARGAAMPMRAMMMPAPMACASPAPPPPAGPMAQAAPDAAASGLFQKLLGRGGPAKPKMRAPGGPPPRERAKREEARPSPEAQPVDTAALTGAVRELVKAVEAALAALRQGQVPPADGVEKAREKLLQLLAVSPRASEVPKLQRFLRAAAVELVAALRAPGAAAASLVPLFERHLDALREARDEVAGDEAFWEGSV